MINVCVLKNVLGEKSPKDNILLYVECYPAKRFKIKYKHILYKEIVFLPPDYYTAKLAG